MSLVQHIALLKFKSEVTSEKIDASFDRLAKLKQVIPGIVGFAGGSYSSSEGLNQGYTHGFIMTFASASARDAYLPHPEHEKVKAEIFPYLDDIIVFDFQA